MRALIKGSVAALVTALTAAALPAAASDIGPEVSMGEILDTYKAVCVAHPGDADAQIAAVKALPGPFDEVEPTDDGTRNFKNGRVMVRVLDNDSVSYCGALGYVAPKTKMGDVVALGTNLHGKPDDVDDGAASWAKRDGSLPVTHVFMLSERPDGLEAAFLLGTRK